MLRVIHAQYRKCERCAIRYFHQHFYHEIISSAEGIKWNREGNVIFISASYVHGCHSNVVTFHPYKIHVICMHCTHFLMSKKIPREVWLQTCPPTQGDDLPTSSSKLISPRNSSLVNSVPQFALPRSPVSPYALFLHGWCIVYMAF